MRRPVQRAARLRPHDEADEGRGDAGERQAEERGRADGERGGLERHLQREGWRVDACAQQHPTPTTTPTPTATPTPIPTPTPYPYAGTEQSVPRRSDSSTSSPHSRSTTTVAAQRGSTLGAVLPRSRQSGAWLGLG